MPSDRYLESAEVTELVAICEVIELAEGRRVDAPSGSNLVHRVGIIVCAHNPRWVTWKEALVAQVLPRLRGALHELITPATYFHPVNPGIICDVSSAARDVDFARRQVGLVTI
jgi:hypothetical protein